MRYQLVFQWPATSIYDYESMLEIESLLIDQLSKASEVDGHDAGSGQTNIFILTNSPDQAFSEAQGVIAAHGLPLPNRAAYREIGRDEYKVLWPKGSKEFSVK